MAVARRRPVELVGSPKPRLAPPTPARSRVDELIETATSLGIDLFPWQRTSGRYSYALGPDDRWLYPEVCEVAPRQNGKTRKLVPFIVNRLRMGRRVMHTAQNRELPREVFGEVAEILGASPGELAVKGGRIIMPRYANGQEEIRMKNLGSYRIVAPTRGGARGPSNDDVIVDEVRELDNFDFIAAAKPTLTASKNPQIHYLSNMGDDTSVVLNGLSARADTDPSLAYLEWSAGPDRAADELAGWIESNPSIGHLPGILSYLEREFRTNQLQGTLAIFETEHLCRRVATMRERLVDEVQWADCKMAEGPRPLRPMMAVSLSPDGKRASAAIAWRSGDYVLLQLLYDVRGDPIDTDVLGSDIRKTAMRLGVVETGYDPLSDPALVKYVKKSKSINGQTYAAASAHFVNLVESKKLRWVDADAVSDDLTWTSRKPDGPDGSYHAVRAQDDRPITAALAAIRAVSLVDPSRPAAPRIR